MRTPSELHYPESMIMISKWNLEVWERKTFTWKSGQARC